MSNGKRMTRKRSVKLFNVRRADQYAARSPGRAWHRDRAWAGYATHETPTAKARLTRRPHWHIHFTPMSASWINQVERRFAEPTKKRLRRGVRRSTADRLPASTERFCRKTMDRTAG